MIDIPTRNAKEFESIKRKVTAYVKSIKGQCCLGALDFGTEKDEYYITLENDGELASDIADFIRKSPNGKLLRADNYKGSYDWASDTYARPQAVVTFKF